MTQKEFDEFSENLIKRYEKMYTGNKWIKRERHNATYLQSKIYRAKQRVDEELEKVKIVEDEETKDSS